MIFTKMHGIGNDFIVADAIRNPFPTDPAALARRLCARRFGVGADGLILMCPSDRADATMRIFNSDGSEPEMCGNGIRCAAKFLYDSGLCRREEMAIDTRAGVKAIRLQPDGPRALVTVDMGAPDFAPARIPVAAPGNRIRVDLGGRAVEFFCASMGNPHAVTFDLYPEEDDFRRFGAEMERHPLFPARANIEFCRVEDAEHVRVTVWERGDGPTLACGTGSCAVLAAGVELGLLRRSAEIRLPGGALRDEWRDDGHIYMTGPAKTVFTGSIDE